MDIPRFWDSRFSDILKELDQTVDGTSNIFAKALRRALTQTMEHVDQELSSMRDDLANLRDKTRSLPLSDEW